MRRSKRLPALDVLNALDAARPKTVEEALASLQALTSEERAMVTHYANREIFHLEEGYEANSENEDAIFQSAIDERQRERLALIKGLRALVVLARKQKAPK